MLINPYEFVSSGGDPNWANVSLLVTFDTGPPWTDVSSNALSLTTTGCSRNTTTPKFGAGCGDFASVAGGTSFSGQVTSTVAAGGVLDLSAGDWTIEGWWKPINSTALVLLSYHYNTHLSILTNGSNSTSITVEGTTITAGAFSNGAYHHLALVMASNQCRCYIDGTATGTAQSITRATWGAGETLYVGATQFGASLIGLVDEIRITKGVARYLANFTPSAVAFPTH